MSIFLPITPIAPITPNAPNTSNAPNVPNASNTPINPLLLLIIKFFEKIFYCKLLITKKVQEKAQKL